MCGIFGFNWEDKTLLKKGLLAIAHRGPDGKGTYSDDLVSLGHNRLAIVDLSKRGLQPMSDSEESIWIIFNGEIYNHKQLRTRLEKKYSFKTNTDTEVLLYLYKEYGPEMLSKIEGMFAFCIYDREKKKLFLARDRPGIKPLYYALINKKFLFASEIKAILECKSIPREIENECLHPYLTFRANTATPKTFFKNIYKLPAGNYLLFDLMSKKIETVCYWSYPFTGKSPKYPFVAIERLLNESVKSQLMSDVPYGVFLSGGIDSGIIASLVNKHSQRPVKTFSVGFDVDKGEVDRAANLAKSINADHHELIIEKSSIKEYPSIIHHADEPMADPTSIPTYLLSRYAKRYCTVILTGEGADEVFGGYPQYRFMKIHQDYLERLPFFGKSAVDFTVKKTPGFMLNKLFPYASALGEEGKTRFSNFLNARTLAERYLEQVSIFNQSEQSALLGSTSDLYAIYQKRFFSTVRKGHLLNALQGLDFTGPMVDDLLMKLDKNAMAFSLEGRVPFLDTSLIECGTTLPDRLKMSIIREKIALRKASKKIVPPSTNKRKKKHFFVPIDSWLEEDLSTVREELLSNSFLHKQNLFRESEVNKILQNFKRSPLFYARQLWTIVTFQLWYQQFINNEKLKL